MKIRLKMNKDRDYGIVAKSFYPCTIIIEL